MDFCTLVQIILYFLWDHLAHSGYFEKQIPVKLEGLLSFANYIAPYEKA